MKKRFWDFKNAVNGTGELYIYGDIVSYKWDDSDTTAQSFKDELEALGDIHTLNMYINSPGGSVFQGQAIYTILKRHKATINAHVDGVAASISSVIPMAADNVLMPRNAMMMVHNPWTMAMGNAKDLRKQADDLDRIRESILEAYLSKTGDKLSRDKLVELLDNETWLTAQECFDYGLCDEIVEAKEIAASIDTELLSRFKNVPESLKNALQKPKNSMMPDDERQKLLAESKENLEKITDILGGL